MNKYENIIYIIIMVFILTHHPIINVPFAFIIKNETTATKTRFMMYLRKKILWCLNMDMVYRNLIKNIECK